MLSSQYRYLIYNLHDILVFSSDILKAYDHENSKTITPGKSSYGEMICLFVLLGFYAAFNVISVISRRQFTYSWSQGKQTSTRLENVPCPSALHHDSCAATGDWTRDTQFQTPDANHLTTADSYIWRWTLYLNFSKMSSHKRIIPQDRHWYYMYIYLWVINII